MAARSAPACETCGDVHVGDGRPQRNCCDWSVPDRMCDCCKADMGCRHRRAIEHVRAIHSPIDAVNYHGGTPRPARVCTGCGTDNGNWQIYPCPTIRALDA